MKRIFVLFCLLALCIIPFGHTQQSNTNKQKIFKVCVQISRDDPTIVETRLRNFVKRELRAIGDVAIVSFEDDWDYHFSIFCP